MPPRRLHRADRVHTRWQVKFGRRRPFISADNECSGAEGSGPDSRSRRPHRRRVLQREMGARLRPRARRAPTQRGSRTHQDLCLQRPGIVHHRPGPGRSRPRAWLTLAQSLARRVPEDPGRWPGIRPSLTQRRADAIRGCGDGSQTGSRADPEAGGRGAGLDRAWSGGARLGTLGGVIRGAGSPGWCRGSSTVFAALTSLRMTPRFLAGDRSRGDWREAYSSCS